MGDCMRKRGAYEAYRTPQCERGAPVMTIGAPRAHMQKRGASEAYKALKAKEGRLSGAPQCERGAPLDVHRGTSMRKRSVLDASVGPYGRLHAKEERI